MALVVKRLVDENEFVEAKYGEAESLQRDIWREFFLLLHEIEKRESAFDLPFLRVALEGELKCKTHLRGRIRAALTQQTLRESEGFFMDKITVNHA
jgi:hypothetical protein